MTDSEKLRNMSRASLRRINQALEDADPIRGVRITYDDLLVILSTLGQGLDTLEEAESRIARLQLQAPVFPVASNHLKG